MVSNSAHPTPGSPEGSQLAEAVLEHAGLFIVVVDRQGRIVRFNPGCEQISGLRYADVRGRLLWEFVKNPGDRTFIHATFTRLAQTEKPIFQYAREWTTAGGQPYWISWTVTSIPAADGLPEYLIATGQDITEAHNLQQQAAAAQALNEKILSEAPLGIGVYRADGQCVLISDPTERIMGVSRDFLLQQNFRQLESWKRSGLLQAAEAALAGQPAQAVEIHTTNTFGSEVWLSCRISSFRLGDQLHLLLVTDDILEQRRTEAELRQTETRYRTLVEQIPAVTYIAALDEYSSSLYYSPQVEAMLGYTPDEMIGQPELWMQMIHPDDREHVYAEINRSTQKNIPFQAEYRLFRKDGRLVWVKDSAQRVKSVDSPGQYQQGIMFDVTEAKQAEQDVQRQAARQAALSEFSQVLAEAGVDINQLLQRLTIKVTELIGDRCILNLISEDGRALDPAVVFDPNNENQLLVQEIFTREPRKLEEQDIARILQTGEPLLIPNFDLQQTGSLGSKPVREDLARIPIHSLMIVPLHAGGQITGVLAISRETPGRPYTPEDQAFLQQLADRAALAIANARLFARSLRQNQELEQRVAERTAALQQSEQTLRDLLNAFPDSTFLLGLDGTILNANREFTNRMGLTPEQVIGRSVVDLLPPDLTASRQEQSLQVLMSGKLVEFEDTQEGSIIHNRISPVFGPDGQIVSLAVYALDITTRRQAEEELYNSRQMLRLVMDTIPQRVFWKDLTLHYIGCNLPCAQDAGFDDPSGLIGKADSDLAWRTDAEIFRAADRKVIDTGLPALNYEEPQVKPDGSVIWVRVSKTPLRDPSGKIIGVLGIFEDITAQRLMQIALNESEVRFRTAFEQAAVGMAHLSPQAVFVRVNRRFCEIVGYMEEDLLARSFADITHPEDLADNLAYVKGLLNGESNSFSTEKRYIRKDGTWVWANTMVGLVRSEDGSPAYFVAVVEDISARKQAQALLEERTRDLARSNADLEQFAYIASHDLQEPLRMVSSFTQLLERRYKGKLDESADEFIHFIIDGTQRMQRLINDLLIYSRVDTRGNPFRPVPVEDLLAQVTSNLQIAVEESGAQITHDPLPTISVDQSQFIQLLQNLLGNAIKFHSSTPPRVHLSARLQEKEWVFSVRDNGIGIDAQHYERIFVLFQRLHLHEEYPGTGIGLAVCKKIIERHGGRIWVESTPGQGSTFYFSIPKQQPVDGSIGRAR